MSGLMNFADFNIATHLPTPLLLIKKYIVIV